MLTSLPSLLFLLFSFLASSIYANDAEEFPVLYQGRYRPAEAYARLWLYEVYHAPTLKKEDLQAFKTHSSSPLNILWSLEILGSLSYQNAPLFWMGSAELKKRLGLTPTKSRLSYQELEPILRQQTNNESLFQEWDPSLLKEFASLHGMKIPLEENFRHRLIELQSKGFPPKEIEQFLEQEYPLIQRLKQAGSLFKSLPSRYKAGDWFPLKALKIQVYQPSSQTLKDVGNFTLFSETDFQSIREAYLNLEQAYLSSDQEKIQKAQQHLGTSLQQAYQVLSGKVIQEAHGKQLTYPTSYQLKIETLYVSYPWIPLLIVLYGMGACLLLIFNQLDWVIGRRVATGIICMAILCHTALLTMRCYILARPPVSNMFETVIYVPWIAACVSVLFPNFRKQPLALISACLISIGLLVILEVTDLNQNLDQVQAVLDSQFWLLIHVLLVVGSYGIFILGALLGHFYLILFLAHSKETVTMKRLSPLILQTMYGGTTLLIIGTILGGIWAAESWGRFWDWDPKESWAFISSCFYLIWIHAYRFHRIASFGLAIGAVSGLLAISFTWYGVNYILGTGLHSYGFGSGGELYYYAFLGTECLFLGAALWAHFYRRSSPRHNRYINTNY